MDQEILSLLTSCGVGALAALTFHFADKILCKHGHILRPIPKNEDHLTKGEDDE